jgi:hypothetical protein
MKALWFCAAVGLVSAAASAHAGDVPSEQLIKQLDDALKASKVSDVEMTKAIVLRHRGSKECKAQKYSAADRHLGEALKIVGKQAIGTANNIEESSTNPLITDCCCDDRSDEPLLHQ